MNEPTRVLSLLCALSLLACGGSARRAQSAKERAASCGGAEPVALRDEVRTGGVFSRLRIPQRTTLTFTCPSEAPCSLPSDPELELIVEPAGHVACEFASCRVPYLATLPIGRPDADDPCPKVLWTVATVHLKSSAGTLDETARDVNVLASPDGEGLLRFMIESPRLTSTEPSAEPRSHLLDVQLEIDGDRVRGRMSALAAPLSSGPASDLHFTAIWSATWESTDRRALAQGR